MRDTKSKTIFGRRLREARIRASIPQDKLGVAVGLDEGSASARISRYETGIHEPPFDTAVKIAEILDVPAAYFYCESEDLAQHVLAWHHADDASRRATLALLTSPSTK